MPLTYDQIVDLVTGTLEDLGKLKWTMIATDLQEHHAMTQILKKKKVKIRSGISVRRSLMVDHSGAAKHVGAFAEDTLNVGTVMKTISVDWRHTTTNYTWDKSEFRMNTDPAEIYDLIKTRRDDAMIALAELMEEAMWSKPADSTDDITPYGLKYWMVGNASEGFYGAAPAGFSAGAGGLVHSRWRNWTFEFDALTREDAIRKIKRALKHTNFKPPIPVKDYYLGADKSMYTTEDVQTELEERVEEQNDNLGADLDKYGDNAVIRRIPIRWAPYLDSDTNDPILGVDWGCIYPFFLAGEYMEEDPPQKAAKQHRVLEVHIDTTWNTLCTDRRKLFYGRRSS